MDGEQGLAGHAQAGQLVGAEQVADDGGVGEYVQGLGDERAERRYAEAGDLTVERPDVG